MQRLFCGGGIMVQDENTAWLISWLENEVANQTYSREYGYMRRYPVEMRDISKSCYQERKDEALTLIYREAVSKYYDFTYNQLYIGRGIERMLQQLETRYGLNFSEMEKEYTARNSGHNPPVE